MAKKSNWGKSVEKIRILVVHGMGEQKRFESIEEIAANMMRSLLKDKYKQANVQVHHASSSKYHACNVSWKNVPVFVQWKADNQQEREKKWIEVSFREVYWADLDRKRNWRNVGRFLWWVLSICGVRYYHSGANKRRAKKGTQEHNPLLHNLKSPSSDAKNGVAWFHRLSLALTAIVFFPVMLIFLLLGFVFSRINIEIFNKIYRALFEYIGDVHLYQDWTMREMQLEGFNEKSRVAIQKRMVSALCKTASEYHAGDIDGYYVFAHSLGTVVAFNALMENEFNLPNYLTEKEYDNLHANISGCEDLDMERVDMPNTIPKRPPWLEPDTRLNRKALLKGLRGFLTVGSPIEKVATLWPAIVPYNDHEDSDVPIPWYNVSDKQDIVGSKIKKYGALESGCYRVGSFYLVNRIIYDQSQPFTAHIAYWYSQHSQTPNSEKTTSVINGSLLDNIIRWIENYDTIKKNHSLGKLEYLEALKGQNTPAATKNKKVLSRIKANLQFLGWFGFLFLFVYSFLGVLLFLFLGGESIINFKWYYYSIMTFGVVTLSVIGAGFCRGLFGIGEYK